MKNHRQKLAAWGEGLAAEHLERQGFRLVARNVRTRSGEIDLVMRREQSLDSMESINAISPLTLFVEVKTRSSTSYGLPEQAVDARKRLHMLAAAEEFIQLHPELQGEWRIDVIAVLRRSGDAPPEIAWFENAVTADE